MSVKLRLQTQDVGTVRGGGFVRLVQFGGEELDLVLAAREHRSSWRQNLAMLKLRFSVIVINCWRDGTGKLSWWKKWTLSVTRRGVVMSERSAEALPPLPA